MKYGKICLAMALLLAASFPAYCPAAESSGTEVTESRAESIAASGGSSAPGWVLARKDWQYRGEDGVFLRNSWVFDNGEWYYLDRDGYMVTDKRRIGSQYYFFREDGSMATGWIYDLDRERWYYADEDGSYHKGWLLAGDSWYWFNSSGRMFRGGRQMADGHLYEFYDNGRLIASGYQGLSYYDANGLKDHSHDIVLKGKRTPGSDEKEAITEAFSEIPPKWVDRFIEEGWELFFYTDRLYMSAPMTDRGIYYIGYKTDAVYKKIKFTDPSSLRMAFGEFIALCSAEDDNYTDVVSTFDSADIDHAEYITLPDYFGGNTAMQFAAMFCNYCIPGIRSEIRAGEYSLAESFDRLLYRSTDKRKPDVEELAEDGTFRPSAEGYTEPYGPARDEALLKSGGPASEGADQPAASASLSQSS